MIRVEYPWNQVGIGNHFFIYSYLRQLSEKLNLKLETNPINLSERGGKHQARQYKFQDIDGDDWSNYETFYVEDNFSNQHSTIDSAVDFLIDKKINIISRGYFPKYSYWKRDKETVKNYFKEFVGDKKYDSDSVAIHLRNSMEDYRFRVNDDFYIKSLYDMGCKKVYLFADNFNRHSQLIDKINSNKNYEVHIMDLDVINSIKEITSFDNIICSQGTFSFWVSFLSSATNIFWPICKDGPNLPYWGMDLTVSDEERYKIIKLDE